MKDKIYRFFTNPKAIFYAYVLVLFIVLSKAILFHLYKGFSIGNNFLIFKYSFGRLINNESMYIYFTNLDLFKYSPTFAVWMAPFYFIPDMLGYILWIILNTYIVYYAFKKVPNLENKYIILALWFITNELITSLMNCQTNPLLLGLSMLAIISIENKNIILSTLFVMIAFFIKPYALAICIMYIFYDNKPKIILYSIFWFIVLAAIPLILVGFDSYLYQLNEWKIMMQKDFSDNFGMSVMGFMRNVFGLEAKNEIIILGTIMLFVPLVFVKKYNDFNFRIKYLASILIWVVIFNHKAESPTFIIPVGGVAIWYYYSEKNLINLILLFNVLIFTQLSSTDFFPPYIRNTYFRPYEIKMLPCFMVWLKLNYDLISVSLKTKMT